MYKALKIRLYPTYKQAQVLNQHFGACRFVYNQALHFKKTEYELYKKTYSKFDMFNWIVFFKNSGEFPWLKEIKAETLQGTITNLDTAFNRFFNGSGYPKFKKKCNTQSFTSTQSFKILENVNKIKFFKHKIKFKCSSEHLTLLKSSKIKQITYYKDACDNYWASVFIEFEMAQEDRSLITNGIGIDLGLKEFLVTSNGEHVENPRFFRKSKDKELALA